MSISLDQAYQIFMADWETSCADKTLIYYRENLTGFFTYVSECFNRPVSEIGCDEVTRELFRNYICYLRKRPKFQNHPFLEPSQELLSSTSIRTYARSIKSFSGLYRFLCGKFSAYGLACFGSQPYQRQYSVIFQYLPAPS